jgi:hypothetical protein
MMSVEQYKALARKRWTEKELDAAVCKLAKALGYRSYHTHLSFMSAEGFPDRVFVRRASVGRCGRVIFCELKVGRNKLSAAQKKWLDDLRAAGAEAYEWRADDLDDIQEVLARDKP